MWDPFKSIFFLLGTPWILFTCTYFPNVDVQRRIHVSAMVENSVLSMEFLKSLTDGIEVEAWIYIIDLGKRQTLENTMLPIFGGHN